MKFKFSLNAPVVLGFSLICLLALILGTVTGGLSNHLIFSVYRSSLFNPLTYLRLFTHILGHHSFQHLLNNMMFILLIGPILEEKYGSKTILVSIIITALITGILQMMLFPQSILLGASGVVFMMIVLVSFTSVKEGEIPLTFVIVLMLFLGQEIYKAIFVKDNISQFAHIIGGLSGSCLGVKLNGIKLFK